MALRRHFLGWDASVADMIADVLLPDPISGPPDLESTLILVPTRQAGRRLRETMALRCAAAGTALLSARVETPALFARLESGGADVASPTQVARTWIAVLSDLDVTRFSGLFPAPPSERGMDWALRTGELVQTLREALADGGWTIGDVVREHAAQLEEGARWQDLARLEEDYLRRLAQTAKTDPCRWKIESVQDPTLPDGIERLVVAAVPDPSVLMIRAVERLADRVDTDILIHAPNALADRFDAFGRPIVDVWQHAEMDVPDPRESIRLAASPAAQGRTVLELIARHAAEWGPADVAVGVPDREVIAPVAAALEAHGLISFDPAGRSPRSHPLYRLIRNLQSLVSTGDYASFAATVRHPDMLAFLQARHGVTPSALMAELDPFQNRHLPASLADMAPYLRADTYPALSAAVEPVRAFCDRLAAGPLDAALRDVLQTVYAARELRHGVPRDDEFTAVAEQVDQALEELRELAPREDPLPADAALELLLRRMERQKVACEREEAVIDLEGWLELAWNSAPLLIVTGMNDGLVPDSRTGDAFLPDPLRVLLGLRNDASRLARDIYLLRSLIESRRQTGRVYLIAGKTSAAGEPLKPSRVLFRCRDEELAQRAEQLFSDAVPARAACPFTLSFPLEVDLAGERAPGGRLPVTAFRSYLTCPFRFYLQSVLNMQACDDEKTELDALDFGTLVHGVLQHMVARVAPTGPDAEQELRDVLRERSEAWVRERFGRRPPLQILIQLDAAQQRLHAAARCHLALVREGWETIASECRCEMELEGLTIRGTIDRVDRHAPSGRVRIIDYKTSDTAVTPAQAHLGRVEPDTPEWAVTQVAGKPRRWIDLQLPLYRRLLATRMDLPETVDVGYFNLPKAVGETGLSLWDGLSDGLQAASETCAAGVVRSIREHRFWPPATRVAYDPFEPILLDDATASVRPVGA